MYVAELRRITAECKYGEALNKMLRDHLVCGVNDRRFQRQLLAETDLTFKKATDLAQAMEAADKNVRDFQASTGRSMHAIHRLTKNCKHCGKRNHTEKDCWTRNATDVTRRDIIAAVCKDVRWLDNKRAPADDDPRDIPEEYEFF